MEIERLTQLIEAEVRKLLAAEGPSENPTDPASDLLVLFTGSSIGLDAAIDETRKMADRGHTLTVALCPMAAELVCPRLEGIPRIAETITDEPLARAHSLVEGSTSILVPVLSTTAAAKLALGIADNFVLTLVLRALRMGKSVIAARNAADPDLTDDPSVATPKTPEPLVLLARNYLRTLESFGMRLIDVSELSGAINPNTTQQHETNGRGKTLISQSVIANLDASVRELLIPNPAIVTPLARDLAKQRGITLRLEKRE